MKKSKLNATEKHGNPGTGAKAEYRLQTATLRFAESGSGEPFGRGAVAIRVLIRKTPYFCVNISH